jgi:hypothetical protein
MERSQANPFILTQENLFVPRRVNERISRDSLRSETWGGQCYNVMITKQHSSGLNSGRFNICDIPHFRGSTSPILPFGRFPRGEFHHSLQQHLGFLIDIEMFPLFRAGIHGRAKNGLFYAVAIKPTRIRSTWSTWSERRKKDQ